MDKLEQLYNLYKNKGLITEATSIDTFRSASDDQKSKLYSLGVDKGLFKETDLITFSSAWGSVADVKKKDATVSSLGTDSSGSTSETFREEVERKREKSDFSLTMNSLGNAFQDIGNVSGLILNELSQLSNPISATLKAGSLFADNEKARESLSKLTDPEGISKKLSKYIQENQQQTDANKIAALWEDGKSFDQAVNESRAGLLETFNEQGAVDFFEKLGWEAVMQIPNIALAIISRGAITALGGASAISQAVASRTALNTTASTFGAMEFGRSLSGEMEQGDVTGKDYLESIVRGMVEGVGTRLFGGIDKALFGDTAKSVAKEQVSAGIKRGISGLFDNVIKTGAGEFMEEGMIELGHYGVDVAFDGATFDPWVATNRFLDGAIVGMTTGTAVQVNMNMLRYATAKNELSNEVNELKSELESQSTRDSSEKRDLLGKMLKEIGEGELDAVDGWTKEEGDKVLDLLGERRKLIKSIGETESPEVAGKMKSRLQEVEDDLAVMMSKAKTQDLTKEMIERSELPVEVESQLTIDDQNNLVLHHYSTKKRDTLIPQATQGNLRISREEQSAISSVGGVTMFYTNASQGEPGVGDVQHTVKVPIDKVYYMNQDPLNLYDEAKARFNKVRPGQAFSPNHQAAWIGKVANEKGFDVILAKWWKGYRAQTTKPMDVSKENVKLNAYKEIDATGATPERIAEIHNTSGGSSISRSGVDMFGMKGYSVSEFKDREVSFDGKEITPEQVSEFMENNADLLDEDSRRFVGTWYSEKTGKSYMDVSTRVRGYDTALEIAQRNDQLAIFNLESGEEIDVSRKGVTDSASILKKMIDDLGGVKTKKAETITGEVSVGVGRVARAIEEAVFANPVNRSIGKGLAQLKKIQHELDKVFRPVPRFLFSGLKAGIKVGKKVSSAAENSFWDTVESIQGKKIDHSFSVTNAIREAAISFLGVSGLTKEYKDARFKFEGDKESSHVLSDRLFTTIQEHPAYKSDMRGVMMALDPEAGMNVTGVEADVNEKFLEDLAGIDTRVEEMLSELKKEMDSQIKAIQKNKDMNDRAKKTAISALRKSVNEDADKRVKEFKREESSKIYDQIKEDSKNKLTDVELDLYNLLRDLNDMMHELNFEQGLIPEDTYKEMKGKYIARLYEEIEMAEIEAIAEKGGIDTKLYKKRKELHEKMTSVTDPVYLTMKRLAQTMQNIAVKQYADAVASMGDAAVSPEKHKELSQTEKGEYTKLTSASGRSFGELEGKYVKNEYVRDFKNQEFLGKFFSFINSALEIYDKNIWRQMTKQGLTVFNPATRMANIVTGFYLASVIGVDPISFAARKVDAKKQMESLGEDYLRVLQSGILGKSQVNKMFKMDDSNIKPHPLADEVRDVRLMGGLDKLIRVGKFAKKNYREASKYAKESYGRADDIAKIATYMSLVKDQGVSPDEAIDRVAKGMQNYATVGSAFSIGSKTPLVGNTFVRFQADLLRIAGNALLDKPLTTAMWIGSTYALFSLASYLSGEDEEERKLRSERPFTPDMFGIPLVWKVGEKEVNMAKYMTPWYQYNMGNLDDDTYEAKWFPVSLVVKNGKLQFKSADPTLGWVRDLALDRDFRGKSIRNPEGSPLTEDEETKNVAIYALRNGLGNAVPIKLIHDLSSVSETGRDYYGRNREISDVIMSRLIRIQDWDDSDYKQRIQDYFYYKNIEIDKLNKDRRRLGSWYNKHYKDINNKYTSQDVIDKKVKDLNENYFNKKQEIELEIVKKYSEWTDFSNLVKDTKFGGN